MCNLNVNIINKHHFHKKNYVRIAKWAGQEWNKHRYCKYNDVSIAKWAGQEWSKNLVTPKMLFISLIHDLSS